MNLKIQFARDEAGAPCSLSVSQDKECLINDNLGMKMEAYLIYVVPNSILEALGLAVCTLLSARSYLPHDRKFRSCT